MTMTAAYEGKTPLEIFRLVAPEFAAVEDTDVLNKITLASVIICTVHFGQNANAALALMAAHLFALPGGANGGADGDGSTSSGRVLSRREGDLAITYGAVSGSEGTNGETITGTTYADLLNALRRKSGRAIGLMTRGPVWGCGCR